MIGRGGWRTTSPLGQWMTPPRTPSGADAYVMIDYGIQVAPAALPAAPVVPAPALSFLLVPAATAEGIAASVIGVGVNYGGAGTRILML